MVKLVELLFAIRKSEYLFEVELVFWDELDAGGDLRVRGGGMGGSREFKFISK